MYNRNCLKNLFYIQKLYKSDLIKSPAWKKGGSITDIYLKGQEL